jgi:hypothetical protein
LSDAGGGSNDVNGGLNDTNDGSLLAGAMETANNVAAPKIVTKD